jgi:AcrR family transcriptional regulator
MARAVADPLPEVDIRERIVAAGLMALSDDNAADLTVRRVAKLAGSSTMCIYTKFGGRTGMVEAVYHRGFELLRDVLTAATGRATALEPTERVVAMATAYRRFALDRPALYGLMFERALPDFDPSPALRAEALGMTITLLTDQVALAQKQGLVAGDDPVRPSYLLWTTMHGLTSTELTHTQRGSLGGWVVDSPEGGERVLVEGVRALLAGLG